MSLDELRAECLNERPCPECGESTTEVAGHLMCLECRRWDTVGLAEMEVWDVCEGMLRPLIAALEAEVEYLKCCGNCAHWEVSVDYAGAGWNTYPVVVMECGSPYPDYDSGESHDWPEGIFSYVEAHHSCHLTPSRWTARSTPDPGDDE